MGSGNGEMPQPYKNEPIWGHGFKEWGGRVLGPETSDVRKMVTASTSNKLKVIQGHTVMTVMGMIFQAQYIRFLVLLS